MCISADGGALAESTYNSWGAIALGAKSPNCLSASFRTMWNIYKMALPGLLSGNCMLDYLNDYGAYGENSAFLKLCLLTSRGQRPRRIRCWRAGSSNDV